MNTPTKGEYRSKVYTDRPDYADFDAPHKFSAIESIILKRLREHPKAICSYSGGSDSDILIDLIERVRKQYAALNLPVVKYVFFNTGLEMKATRDHVKAVSEKYGVDIQELRPTVNIVQATRKHGQPFVSKIMSAGLEEWQKKGIPLSIAAEYAEAEDKAAKRQELRERYPKCESVINFLYVDIPGRRKTPLPAHIQFLCLRQPPGTKARCRNGPGPLAAHRAPGAERIPDPALLGHGNSSFGFPMKSSSASWGGRLMIRA